MGELRRISVFDAETQRTAEPQRTSLRAMYLTRDFVFPANHVELVQQLLVVAKLELRQKLRLMTRMTLTSAIQHGQQPSPWFSAALRPLCAFYEKGSFVKDRRGGPRSSAPKLVAP